MTLTVLTDPDLKLIARALKKLGPTFMREMASASFEAVNLLEREVKERTPTGVGGGAGLKGSIVGEMSTIAVEKVEGMVSTPLPYATPVELGTKPHFPPLNPLKDWAVAKLGVKPNEAAGIAYAIARKISRVGTEGQFMFRDTWSANESQVIAMFTSRAEKALKRTGAPS